MYKSTSFGTSFLGSYLFKQLVPENHPLKILSQIASFTHLDEKLKHLYSEKGQKAYPPSMMVRISILKDLYNISDEKVIQMVKENIPARMYAGISLEQRVPNSSDLTYFRRRLGEENFQTIFDETIEIAKRNNLKLGDILLIDSTHSQAKINQKTQGKTKETRDDPDASFAHKSPTRVFFGYKHHTAQENNHNLIISIQTTTGRIHDNRKLQPLMEETLEKIPAPRAVAADKAYDSQESHQYLENQGIFSAIHLKNTRFQTKEGEFKTWGDDWYLRKYLDPRYEEVRRERYKVEQPYAEMKRYHGLGRSRYLGLEKNQIQAYLTASVYNLKHILSRVKENITVRKLNYSFQSI